MARMWHQFPAIICHHHLQLLPRPRQCVVATSLLRPFRIRSSLARTWTSSVRSETLGTVSASQVQEQQPQQVDGISRILEEVDEPPPAAGADDSSSSKDRRTLRTAGTRGGAYFYPKRGQDVELVCESLAFKGMGVCKVVETGFVVLCERALPGEHLVARIVKKKQGFAEAYKTKTLSSHHDAVAAPCQHFGDCGGCKTQSLAYSAQLREKEQQVHDLIARIGKFGFSEPDGPTGNYLRPIVPCEKQFRYRNKMEFSFGTQKWTPREEMGAVTSPDDPDTQSTPQNFALGLHAPRRFDKILPINECLLQSDVANQILQEVKKYCQVNTHKMPAYDPIGHEGFLRHLMIRSGTNCDTGNIQVMVNMVTTTYQPDLLQPLVKLLADAYPQMVSFVNNVTSSPGPTSVGQEEYVLHGVRTIQEALRGLTFQISANSFFQTNTSQAEVLYKLVEDQCNLKGDCSETVLDLFCGTGTIGLSLAHKAKHVYGVEVVPQAVADARRNAEENGIKNATFFQGDLNKLTAEFGNDFSRPDVVITDPNRPGMHPKLVRYLLNLRPRRIVYVSCNPATCARDLDLLCHEGEGSNDPQVYRLASVQPVDMFPHTPHVECVSVLELRS